MVNARNLLETYRVAIAQKQRELAQQIKERETEVKTAFKDYCNVPYYLHAILIHDGTAESGHYYSFIYDRKQDLWWRFSDVNVSIEVEDVVFRESFGGQTASLKTAYSLIYINEFCKKSIEDKVVTPFLMGKFMTINGELRNRITMDNNAFQQAYTQYCAKKISDSIRRRYNDKKRQVTDSKSQLDQILHMNILNLIFHLHY